MQQSELQKMPAPLVRGGSARLYTRQIAVLALTVFWSMELPGKPHL